MNFPPFFPVIIYFYYEINFAGFTSEVFVAEQKTLNTERVSTMVYVK